MHTQESETLEGIRAFYPKSVGEWREWLSQNCQIEKAVWLITYHKNSNFPGISYNEAIEQALCFGWIDSKAKKRDQDSSYLKFTPRKPGSNWSKSNIERVRQLTSHGLMTSHGQALIDIAKNSGKWNDE